MKCPGLDNDSKLEGVRLGHRPDEDIARELGISPGSVRAERSRRGIAKFRGSKPLLRGEKLAADRVTRTELADEKREACQ